MCSTMRPLQWKVNEEQVIAIKFHIGEKSLQNTTDAIAVTCNRPSHHKVSES